MVWILNTNSASQTTNPTYQYPNMTLNAIDAVTNTLPGSSASGNVPARAPFAQHNRENRDSKNAAQKFMVNRDYRTEKLR